MQQEKISVMIVDDHLVVRRGLRTLLEVFDDMELIAEASNGQEAIELCREIMPDVILMDIVMPEMDGIKATQTIMAEDPDVCIIALTSFDDEPTVRAMLNAGAIGYVLKNSSMDDLSSIIRAAFTSKSTVLAPEITNKLLNPTSLPANPTVPKQDFNLTQREIEVLTLLVSGKSNREIARELTISLGTVKSHVSVVIAKLGVSNRVEAATLAVQANLVPSSN